MTTIDTMLSMPEELLLQIFSYLEYRDIVSVGRTCKLGHHLSQDELLLRKIKARDFTPDTWTHRNDTLVPYICITSTGPTADLNSDVLGLYALSGTRHGGKPVYQQMDTEIDGSGGFKIWYGSMNQIWTVGKIDSNQPQLLAKTTTSNPTTAAWQFKDYDHYHQYWFYRDDVALTVTAMVQLPPACSVIISCASSRSLPRGKFHPEVLGEYAATARYQKGRVVYKHVDQELYLAVGSGPGGAGCWTVQKEVGRVCGDCTLLHSQTAPTLCPAHPRAARTDRWGGKKYWRWRNMFIAVDSKKKAVGFSGRVVVKCLTH